MVEHVFEEQNMLDVYFLVEGFCYLVTERMVAIEKQKVCPNDLKEAIASLIFTAPRCADLPELQEVCSIFSVKYGYEFSTAAVELRPDSGVNRQIIEKLSTRQPSTDIKLWLLKEIAAENGMDWDFEKAEKELLRLAEDLLDGPQHFVESQVNQNDSNGARQVSVLENVEGCIESNNCSSSRNVVQPASVSQSTPGFCPSPSPYPESQNEKKLVYSASQGHTRLHDDEKCDSSHLYASHIPVKAKPVESSRLAGTIKSKISEDPYNRLRKDDKIDCRASTETVKPSLESQEFPSSNDDYHSFTKFTKTDEVPITAQAAFESAAQAAFESAAHATEAGNAAVSLVKHKPLIKESTQSGKSWREADLESELDEAIEVALARSVCILGNNCEDNSSAKMGEACSIKSSRTRKNEKISVSHPGSGFAWVTSSQKVGINLNGEETLEDPVSLVRAKQFQAYKYGQQHLEDYNDNAEESEFSADLKNRNLHVKQ